MDTIGTAARVKKILVIDVTSSMRSLYRLIFDEEDYNVVVAGPGRAALSMIETDEQRTDAIKGGII